MDLPTANPALTPDSFIPGEFSPTWSPNGRNITFASWDDDKHGQLWTVSPLVAPAATHEGTGGDNLNPSMEPDGAALAYSRGPAQPSAAATGPRNEWYDIVLQPASGGTPQTIVRLASQDGPGARPSLVPEAASYFTNIALKRRRPIWSKERYGSGVRSERWIGPAGARDISERHPRSGFRERPAGGLSGGRQRLPLAVTLDATGQEPLRLDRSKTPAFTVKPASLDGGMYPHWRDATTVEYGNANKYFLYHTDTAKTDTTEIHLGVPRAIRKDRWPSQIRAS